MDRLETLVYQHIYGLYSPFYYVCSRQQKAAILNITGIAAFSCLYEKALKSKVGTRMVHDPVI